MPFLWVHGYSSKIKIRMRNIIELINIIDNLIKDLAIFIMDFVAVRKKWFYCIVQDNDDDFL